ncbi:MAG UNVERIFIED_CONTAM: FkbM family methyltransferase [Microcystis novacekii LVE1205-3]
MYHFSTGIIHHTSSSKWTPVDCTHLIEQSQKSEIPDPNHGELLARWTSTNPPFFVSVHAFYYDKLRKVIYDTGQYYEQDLSHIFHQILKDAPPNSRVLDVGGNIGWFSLLSASHGHHVDVFEPNMANILRLCESKRMNQWTTVERERDLASRSVKQGSIHIWPFGVGSNNTNMTFYIGKNPGKATLVRSMIPKWRNPDTKEISIISLDSMAHDLKWFELRTPIVILKVDVEGFEPSVFAGAKSLLHSGLIENIIMELSAQKDNSENADMLQLILDAGYVPHQVGLFGDITRGNKPPLDHDFVAAFLAKFANHTKMQSNLWWKRKQ